MSDLCAHSYCDDIALPGRDLCSACEQERQTERAITEAHARDLTDANERRLLSDEDLLLPLGVLVAEEVAQ